GQVGIAATASLAERLAPHRADARARPSLRTLPTLPAPGGSPMTDRDVGEWMRADWDARARDDAYYYVHSARRDQTEAEFAASGEASVAQLVRADLPTLTQGRDPATLRLLELGCGVGRMTRPLAAVFGEVVGVDVSPEM